MMTYLVIGLCLILLLAVIIIAAKPIGMGIEARRNIKDSLENSEDDEINNSDNSSNISDEILKLKKLKDDNTITDEEFEKAKKKIID
tara:strand:+ start:357 stop:617 length:261 start_codon:yes stop_codon:yes gene_type:complete